ncbi:MAG: acetylglutamate kinase [Planctomycetes bacterium]|nr:acetylglutamate kinase [Planctomycetota bacterium]
MKELIRAASYVRAHCGAIMVIKVGGACLRKPRHRRDIAQQIATIQALGGKPVVVHGGGPQTDELQNQLGDVPHMVDGRRVTTEAALRALRMSVVGELNGEFAAALTHAGAPAVGLCAADAGLVIAKKRAPMRTSEGMTDFGAVGDVQEIRPSAVLALLEQGITPVICPPVSDGAEGFLNLNADTLAAELAIALRAAKLVLLAGAAGVLGDPTDPLSVLSHLSVDQLLELDQNGALKQGMKVKAVAIQRALEGGVGRVHMVSGVDPESLLVELYTTHGSGTLITIEPAAELEAVATS